MGAWGTKITLRAGLALFLVLALAGMVMAAGPRPVPGPPARGQSVADTVVNLVGWSVSVRAPDTASAVLAVVTANGTFDVEVSQTTRIVRAADGQSLTPGDLVAAMPLDVQGRVTDQARIAATVVSVGEVPPTTPSERLTLRGRILAVFGPAAAVGERQLLVVSSSRGEAVLEVDGQTLIVESGGRALAFGDLHAGQTVLVEALGSTRAVARALSIEVMTSGRPPQVTVEGLLLARGPAPDSGERWIVGEVLVLVPAELARAHEALKVGGQVSVTAQRNRAGELEALQVRVPETAARSQVVELRGRLDRHEGSLLWVDGLRVNLGAEVSAPPGLAVGAFLKIRARLDPDGSLAAEAITILPPGKVDVQFEGAIESLTASEWRVAGVTVRLTDATVVVGDTPMVGGHAEVSGTQLGARAVEARRIKVVGGVTPAWSAVEGHIVDMPRPPAIWRVLDRNKQETEVVISESTVIDESLGVARVGAWVQVQGALDAMGSRVLAERVRVRRSAH